MDTLCGLILAHKDNESIAGGSGFYDTVSESLLKLKINNQESNFYPEFFGVSAFTESVGKRILFTS